jgi:mRNA interferase MazF
VVDDGYVPDRGDVIWVSLPAVPCGEMLRHPAVVLSPRTYNARVGLAILCPIADTSSGYPFEVTLPSEARVAGVILADQVKSLDWAAREAELVGHVPPEVVAEALHKLTALLTP